MSYTTLDPVKTQVGKPLTKELVDTIKNDLDDHETRIGNIEAGSSKIPIFDFEIINNTQYPDLKGVAYFTAKQAFTVTQCFIQIFTKGVLTGVLEVDVRKSAGLNLSDASFTSIFTTKPSITYASVADYAKSTNQVFNAGQAVAIGEVLRLDLSVLPSGGVVDKFIVCCFGDL